MNQKKAFQDVMGIGTTIASGNETKAIEEMGKKCIQGKLGNVLRSKILHLLQHLILRNDVPIKLKSAGPPPGRYPACTPPGAPKA